MSKSTASQPMDTPHDQISEPLPSGDAADKRRRTTWNSRSLHVAMIVVLFTIAGTVLRLNHAEQRQFWGDEIHTYEVANKPTDLASFWHTWWHTRQMADPPLYYFASYLNVSGSSSHSHLRLRLTSILFGVLAIPLTYILFRRLGGRGVGLVGAALMAFSTFAVQYSQEYRPYSMLLFFSLLFLDALVLVCDGFTWLRWWYLVAGALGLIYTHYFGGFALAAGYLVWAFVLLRRQGETPVRTRLVAVLGLPMLLLLLYLPVLIHAPSVMHDQSPTLNPSSPTLQLYLSAKKNINYLTDLPSAFMGWRLGKQPLWQTISLSCLALAGLLSLAFRKPRLLFAGSIWTLVGIVLSVCFYEIAKYPYESRRNIFQLPVMLFLLAEGIAAPWLIASLPWCRSRALQAVARTVSVVILTATLTIFGLNYVRYDAKGWRNESNQADWRGMARFIAEQAAPEDVVVVPIIANDTWLRLHYMFYHEQLALKQHVIQEPSLPYLRALQRQGRHVWFLVAEPWKLPKDMFEFLVTDGQWHNLFGGSVVLLSPHTISSNGRTQSSSFFMADDQRVALVCKRGDVSANIVLSGPKVYRSQLTTTSKYALLDLPKGVYKASVTLDQAADTTLTIHPHVQPGRWQSAARFSEILPSSSRINTPLHDGSPILFMQYNGVVTYRFFLDEGGEFDLCLKAKDDKPGPVHLRVFLWGMGEIPSVVFDKDNNGFSTISRRVRLGAGLNEMRIYFDSFRRIAERRRNPEDEYCAFEFVGWKLDRIGDQ